MTALLKSLLHVTSLEITFTGRGTSTRAVSDVSFSVSRGETLCLIGESGSGKSITLRALMGLLPVRTATVDGSIMLNGTNMLSLSERLLSRVRGAEIAMVFQEPMTALDPVFTIGDQIIEAIRSHETVSRSEAWRRALELLELVRIPSPERRLKAYPHELSGGLRQRAMIAVALACRPELLLADEPTTALDATVQIQVLILLKRLQANLGMGMIFVTHDLSVAAQIADKVAVMYAGRIVEFGSARDVLIHPRHPYTQGLIRSTVHGQDRHSDINSIPGSPPDIRDLPRGCTFAPRCGYAIDACRVAVPPLLIQAGSAARCIRADDIARDPTPDQLIPA